MATRVVDFADGFTSASAPTQAANSYADDAAFVTAKGSAAANGDWYYDSTLNTPKDYVNGAWVKRSTSPANTIKGNNTGSVATTLDLTASQAAVLLGAINKVVVRSFTSTTTSFAATAGAVYTLVEVQGGGGGGGGAAGVAGQCAAAGGGGAGGYARKVYTAAQIAAAGSTTITVGGTAAGGAAGANPGAAGNNSVFLGLLTANGGAAGGAGSASTGIQSASGGIGGATSAADFSLTGKTGGAGMANYGTGNGFVVPGYGGDSYFAGAGVGVLNTTGGSATGYGSGGGGGSTFANPSSMAGGSGFQGIVIITEYCAV